MIVFVGGSLLWLTTEAWEFCREKSTGEAGTARRERALLFLYAAGSAAYLLTYKDVWEHHYVLLLPPLILLALRGERFWLWLPPFLLSALPTPFFLYDLPKLGFTGDPQAYWHPAVSLLHHAWKPVAPLWLLGGLTVLSIKSQHGLADLQELVTKKEENTQMTGSRPTSLTGRNVPQRAERRRQTRQARSGKS